MSSKEVASNDAPIDADLASALASLNQGGLFSDQQGGGSPSEVVLPVEAARGGGTTDQGMLVEEKVVVSDVDSTNVSKKFRVFLMPGSTEEVSNLCRFSIGGGSRVCVTKRDCSVSHRGKGLTKLVTGAFYLAKLTGEIFAEPSVPSMMLMAEVYADWVKAQKSLDDWTQNYKSSAELLTLLNLSDLFTKQAFFGLAQVFRTPGKKTKTVIEEETDLPSNQLSLFPYERKVSALEGFSTSGIPEAMRNVCGVVYYLDQRAENSSEDVLGSHLSCHSVFVANSWKSLKSSKSRIDFSVSTIGSKPRDFTQDHDAPTIWGGLTSVTGAVVKLAVVKSISTSWPRPLSRTVRRIRHACK